MIWDVAIVGAGPGGLSAANRLSELGLTSVLLDCGKVVASRDRENPSETTSGVGGAGLFSDGKFSFFPSASALWQLADRHSLEQAYLWTCELFNSYGLNPPQLPHDLSPRGSTAGEWFLKSYPSYYLPLESRIKMTQILQETISSKLLTETSVMSWRYSAASDRFELELNSGPDKDLHHIMARQLILAGGRFGPVALGAPGFESDRFHRLEFGFRVEQSVDDFFLAAEQDLDPKYCFADPTMNVEWRTFCTCRSGETVLSDTNGLWTVSGRADCPPTGRSNAGFNTRILDASLAAKIWGEMSATLRESRSYYRVPLREFLFCGDSNEIVLQAGPLAAGAMRCGLKLLSDRFPSLLSTETDLIGPTLEGVGWYPANNDNLRCPNGPAWVVGDATGKFRGIVAAMVSGHYAASRAALERGAR